MKKILLTLLALPLLAITACSSDDDKPQVNVDLSYGNSTVANNEVYVVKPDTFKVTSVKVTPVREGHKATNGPVSYFLNGVPLGTNPVQPFGIAIPTDDMETGAYSLQLSMPILEEGCELANGLVSVTVNVVASADDIPSAAVPSATQHLECSIE